MSMEDVGVEDAVFGIVSQELVRQYELRAQGRFKHVLADPELTDDRRLTILTEELGEVAREIQEGNAERMEAELVQVAALTVSWLMGIAQRA